MLLHASNKADSLHLVQSDIRDVKTEVVVVLKDGEVRCYAPYSHHVDITFIDGDDPDPRTDSQRFCKDLEDGTHPNFKDYARVW